MSEIDNSLVQQILSKLDKLTENISEMKASIGGTLERHGTQIAQLQKEKEQLFSFWNGDFPKLEKEVADNRHTIKNAEGATHLLTTEVFKRIEDLEMEQKKDTESRIEEHGKIKYQNKVQNGIMFAIAIITVILTYMQTQ